MKEKFFEMDEKCSTLNRNGDWAASREISYRESSSAKFMACSLSILEEVTVSYSVCQNKSRYRPSAAAV